MEWTRQVLENIAPNARLNPAIRSQALAVQMYGNAAVTDKITKVNPANDL